MTITPQNIITAGALLSAVLAIFTIYNKIVRWVDRQGKQDAEINALRKHHDEDMKRLQTEQTLLVYGILACLKGLKEQGCNGPVTNTIDKIEKYLNLKAHDQIEENN